MPRPSLRRWSALRSERWRVPRDRLVAESCRPSACYGDDKISESVYMGTVARRQNCGRRVFGNQPGTANRIAKNKLPTVLDARIEKAVCEEYISFAVAGCMAISGPSLLARGCVRLPHCNHAQSPVHDLDL